MKKLHSFFKTINTNVASNSNTFKAFIFLLLSFVFSTWTQAQTPACNIGGSLQACARLDTAVDERIPADIIIPVEIAQSGHNPTLYYTITNNTTGAFFRNISLEDTIYNGDFNSLMDTLTIFPGTGPGGFLLNLMVINNESGDTNYCSKSVTVFYVSGSASHPPILCYGDSTTITVTGVCNPVRPISYMISYPWGGTSSNTNGIFPNLPAPYIYELFINAKVSADVTCQVLILDTVTQPDPNPIILNCPNDTTIPAYNTTSVSTCYNFDNCVISTLFQRDHAYNVFGNGNPGCLSDWEVGSGTPSVFRNTDGLGTAYNGTQFTALAACGDFYPTIWSESVVLKHDFVPGKTYKVSLALRTTNTTAFTDVDFVLLQNSLGYVYNSTIGCSVNPAIPASGLVVKQIDHFATPTWQIVNFTIDNLSSAYNRIWIRPLVEQRTTAILCMDSFCITDVTPGACLTQADVNTQFNLWKNSFKHTGGTGPKVLTDLTSYTAPGICGGKTTIVYTVADTICPDTVSCTKTFALDTTPELIVTCPDPVKLDSCLTLANITAAYDAWKAGFTVEGGCTPSDNRSSIPALPQNVLCNGASITFKFIAQNSQGTCPGADSCTSTFEVAPVKDLLVACPSPVKLDSCRTLADITTQYDAWKAGFKVEGGCNPSSNIAAIPALPLDVLCNGASLSFKLIAENEAGKCIDKDSCTSTFQVAKVSDLVVTCPEPVKLDSCKTLTDITTAYNRWRAAFKVEGGCNPSSNISGIPELPQDVLCNGASLSFKLIAENEEGKCIDKDSCTSTFEVAPVTDLIVTCPEPVKLDSCRTQDNITTAYTAWVNGFKVEGGCNPSHNKADIPALPENVLCNGASLSFKLVARNAPGTCEAADSCESKFEVAPVTPLKVTCPAPQKLDSCRTLAEITTAYDAWKSGFKVEGGCNPTSNIAGIPALPENVLCNGASLTFKLKAQNAVGTCEAADSCESTFEVAPTLKLEVTCPDAVKLDSCKTLADITDAYDRWREGFGVSGGCNPSSNIDLIPSLPADALCNGASLTFKLIAENEEGKCVAKDSCTSTFEVAPVTELIVTCPEPVKLDSCRTLDNITTAYTAWVNGFTVQGGCNPSHNKADIPALPENVLCNGASLTFKLKAQNTPGTCEAADSCTSTFEVAPVTELTVSCPQSVKLDSCKTLAEITTAYDAWKAEFKVEGGCNPTSNIAGIPALPENVLCNGASLTFKLKAQNAVGTCEAADSCESKFEVAPTLKLEVKCPDPVKLEACTDTTAIKEAYNTWKSLFEVTGGCNPSTNIGQIPALPNGIACGGKISFTYIAQNEQGKCVDRAECTSTFEVDTTPKLEVICPQPVKLEACSDTTAIKAAYQAWKNGFDFEGGCNPTTNIADIPALPENIACGGKISFEYRVDDKCNTGTDCPGEETWNLYASYPLDGNAIDTTNGLNGVYVGAPAPAMNRFGEAGKALQFNGTTDYINLPEEFDYPERSIAAWFNVTGLPAGNGNVIYSSDNPTLQHGLTGIIVYNPGNGIPTLRMGSDNSFYNTPVSYNTWYHVAVVRTPTYTKAYLNGALVSNIPNPSGITSIAGAQNARIGADRLGAGKLIGRVDDVRIYKGALSDCEIAERFTTSVCQSTFEVDTAEELVVECPKDVRLDSCSSAADILEAYNEWKEGFTYRGGCSPTTNKDELPELPEGIACGGKITFTYIVENGPGKCPGRDECTSTFEVDTALELEVTCPLSVKLDSCTSESEIIAKYNEWKAGFTYKGGCNPTTNIDELPELPEGIACGGKITFTYIAQNEQGKCEGRDECTSTFEVDTALELQVVCPDTVRLKACTNEADILTAYNDWIAGFKVLGGCNPSSNINAIPELPENIACGGKIVFTFTAQNEQGKCIGRDECRSSFEVDTTTELVVTCPEPVRLDSCITEAEILTAYNAWKEGFKVEGGCDPVTNMDDFPELPQNIICGGEISFKLIAENGNSSCGLSKDSCTSTFTVGTPTELVVTCSDSVTLNPCTSEADILLAYNTWKEGFNYKGGCNPTTNIADFPALPQDIACGGEITFHYIAQNAPGTCYDLDECASTFRVAYAPEVKFTCGDDVNVPACSDQATIDAAWAQFLGSTTASGGCYGVLDTTLPVALPAKCGDSVMVTWTYRTYCDEPYSCTRKFKVGKSDLTLSGQGPDKTINCPAIPVFTPPTATNCANPIITEVDTVTPGICEGTYVKKRTWRVTDDCGNSGGPVSQTITVQDNTPPTISCPKDETVGGGKKGDEGPCIDLGGGGVAIVDANGYGNKKPVNQDKIDFRQVRNEDHPEDSLYWTNGINNITQAEYFEGMGVPQRIILTGLTGNKHKMVFRHEAVKHQSGVRHAYDFLMSWEQAIATAADIGNGARNELQELMDQACSAGISGTAKTVCQSLSALSPADPKVKRAVVTDLMGNPPNHHGTANVNDVITCFEREYGNRDIEMRANAAITDFKINFDGYSGRANGDNYAWYTITWTSTASNVMFRLAGRPAVGAGECGYGSCFGAGSIDGGPYHFKLEDLDDHSMGNRDNQVMVNQSCVQDTTATFGTPTAKDACDPNPTIEQVGQDQITTNSKGERVVCRTWKATDDCLNSAQCTQCITLASCLSSKSKGNGGNTSGTGNNGNSNGNSNNGNGNGKGNKKMDRVENPDNSDEETFGAITFRAYPNPSNSIFNFDMIFDEAMENVSLEIYNVTGQKLAELYRGSVDSDIKYHTEFNASHLPSGTYFYRLVSNDGTKVGKLAVVR